MKILDCKLLACETAAEMEQAARELIHRPGEIWVPYGELQFHADRTVYGYRQWFLRVSDARSWLLPNQSPPVNP